MRTLKKKHGFQAILDVHLLRRLGGERSFKRGQEYFENKRVSALAERDGVITAMVRGTHPYVVRLQIDGGRLGHSCTCPIGNGGEFCKHCVAAGLAWLEAPEGFGHMEIGRTPAPKPARAAVTMKDVQAFLARQQKNDLIKILLEQARDDERLRQRLLVRASKQNPKSLDLSSYKGAIAGALDPGHFVDYHGMFAYARDIEETIDPLAELLEEGKAAEVIELSEYALAAVENALGSGTIPTARWEIYSPVSKNCTSGPAGEPSPNRKRWPGGFFNGSSERTGTPSMAQPKPMPVFLEKRGWTSIGNSPRQSGPSSLSCRQAARSPGDMMEGDSGSRASWRRWPNTAEIRRRS